MAIRMGQDFRVTLGSLVAVEEKISHLPVAAVGKNIPPTLS